MSEVKQNNNNEAILYGRSESPEITGTIYLTAYRDF